MSEAVENLHAIERLLALAEAGPRTDVGALQDAHAVMSRIELENRSSRYKAEKLKAVSDGFDSWLGAGSPTVGIDSAASRNQLIRDIHLLRKALARGAEGQD